jgi:hypothetical protein
LDKLEAAKLPRKLVNFVAPSLFKPAKISSEAVLKPRSDDLCAKFSYKRVKIFSHINQYAEKFLHVYS